MKLLNTPSINLFAIELYANSKRNLTDYFGITHPGKTEYRLYLNPDSSVILHCSYSGKEKDTYHLLETGKEYDFVLNDFS